MYCPACHSPRIESLRANTPAHDFRCPACLSWFQLKSKSSPFGRRVQDGAFGTMRRSIMEDKTPGLFLLQYSRPEFRVENVLLIPHFVFNESTLERRKPLSPNAERAGWIGCNFMLDRIPHDARIGVVVDRKPRPASEVRGAYAKLRPLEWQNASERGWTLDVLSVVRSLNKSEFSLGDIYAHSKELGSLHPGNRHVTDKIRQQLQVLRDLGLVQFLGAGHYRLR